MPLLKTLFTGRLSRGGFLIPALLVLSPYILIILIYPHLHLLFNSKSPFSLLSYLGYYYSHPVESALLSFSPEIPLQSQLFLLLPILLLPMVIQRLHDMNKSGWFSLFFIVPFLNVFMTFILLGVPGEKEKNRYGTVPKRYSPLPAFIVLGVILFFIIHYLITDFLECSSSRHLCQNPKIGLHVL